MKLREWLRKSMVPAPDLPENLEQVIQRGDELDSYTMNQNARAEELIEIWHQQGRGRSADPITARLRGER